MAEPFRTQRPADCRCTQGARCMPCLVDKGVIPPPPTEAEKLGLPDDAEPFLKAMIVDAD